jgi:NitT/TauT family transport system substrate-binding protein
VTRRRAAARAPPTHWRRACRNRTLLEETLPGTGQADLPAIGPRPDPHKKNEGEDPVQHHLIRAFALVLVAIVGAASASAAIAAERVRVGKAVPFAWTFTPIEVGIETGTFAKHGLEFEVTGFAGDARLQQGLVSGSIDFGLGSGPGMGFLAKGVPAKAVAAMAGAPMNMSMVVPYDSPIKTLDDIKGKKVGITTVGSLTDWLLKRVVSEKQWAPTAVTAVTVGGMDSTKAALKTGQIDAVVIALELGYALEQAKEWRVVSLLAPFAPDFHTHVIFARDELIANKPDVVERFLRAWFETIAYMRANKERTVEITAKVLNLDKAVLGRVYDEQIKIFTADGRFDPKALAVIRQSLVEMGILQRVPDDSVMFTTRFLPVKY